MSETKFKIKNDYDQEIVILYWKGHKVLESEVVEEGDSSSGDMPDDCDRVEVITPQSPADIKPLKVSGENFKRFGFNSDLRYVLNFYRDEFYPIGGTVDETDKEITVGQPGIPPIGDPDPGKDK